MRISIARAGSAKAVIFAASELERYLKLIDPETVCELFVCDKPEDAPDFALTVACSEDEASEDDSIRLDVKQGVGRIAGSNPRATLIAVYRFLSELGCAFISPEREEIPSYKLDGDKLCCSLAEAASYRHRGICIEGSIAYEHAAAMIDWLPKAAMNSYFVQFRIPFTFFDRFYSAHGIKRDENDVAEMYSALVEEIDKRGLVYHATGHGWTCEPFGVSGTGWYKSAQTISPEIKQYFAEVNGKRELWGDIALDTNLCYSNPEVRSRIANAIADYCVAHPRIDCLHFWLADGSNNHCECENCRKQRPSDFYVETLNEVDAALSKAGSPVKVVFLIYVDLLWEPKKARFNNPDRFIMMFAPITRTYSHTFTEGLGEQEPALAPYERNKLKMPSTVTENVARLKRWQNVFKGDSFDFDYHLMWDHIRDPGYCSSAAVLFYDMCNLDSIGLNGMISCQLQRVGFPTWLPMYAMSRALWNKKLSFDEVCAEYFTAEFGEDGKSVCDYLTGLSKRFDPPYLRGEKPVIDPEAAERYSQIPSYIDEHRHILSGKFGIQWEKLRLHANMCVILAEGLAAKASCDADKTEECHRRLITLARETEATTVNSLDLWNFENIMRGVLR